MKKKPIDMDESKGNERRKFYQMGYADGISKLNTVLQELYDMQVDENMYGFTETEDGRLGLAMKQARNQAKAQFRSNITSKFIK